MIGAKMERNMGVLGITDITDTTAVRPLWRSLTGITVVMSRLWQAAVVAAATSTPIFFIRIFCPLNLIQQAIALPHYDTR